MNQFLKSLIQKFRGQNLTVTRGNGDISNSREFSSRSNREAMDSFSCPYCLSKNFQKRGFRQKKLERAQLYLCLDCHKTFTSQITKGKHYPLAVMLDAISIYNLGYSLEETCRIINSRMNKKAASSEAALADAVDSRSPDTKNSVSPVYNVVNSGGEPENRTPSLTGRIAYRASSATMPIDSPPKSILTHINLFDLQPSTLSNWIAETESLCRYCQMRQYIMQKYNPKDVVVHATLAHRQLYRYRFHRGKCELLINHEYRHRKFNPLREFLELVPGECPHQYFQEGLRASEAPLTFSKTAMIVRGKTNFATRLAEFVLQSVKDRKLRHEALQKFMLANDSVTVATEVPVYIMRDDIEHMKTQLGFEIYQKENSKHEARNSKQIQNSNGQNSKRFENSDLENSDIVSDFDIRISDLPKLITGHIDILQIRNGMVHILDYKPKAEKERPIEQLTLYAMALSRLTGLRLFEFKCAWFDEKDYFEFYPLHVLHKPRRAQRRRKVNTQEGTYLVNKNEKKVESIRPI